MHITINGLAKEGDGVGRCPDGSNFVRGALPGEKVHVVLLMRSPNFVERKLSLFENACSSSRSIL
ncbi:MAG: hypothetical protein CM15mP49_13760 [Actinomycetota bacterium]|nr:MAG: hypothetical protein CM15mP49_13760 [Actinomycetota bacterium]